MTKHHIFRYVNTIDILSGLQYSKKETTINYVSFNLVLCFLLLIMTGHMQILNIFRFF